MEGCMENLWEVRKNWTTRNNVNWNDSGGQSIKNWGLISFGSQHEDEQTCHFPAPMLLFSKFQEEGIWLDQPGACTHLWWEEDVALRSCCPIRSNAGDVCSIPDREAEWWPKMLKNKKQNQTLLLITHVILPSELVYNFGRQLPAQEQHLISRSWVSLWLSNNRDRSQRFPPTASPQ